jgi:hypothetical protein
MRSTKRKYVIVRAAQAGCFAGELESQKGDSVVLVNSRRIWYWEGAASLSQLAQEGTSHPSQCMFPVAVKRQQVLGVIEILDTTVAARKSLTEVPIWRF